MSALTVPAKYPRIRLVRSFHELITTPLANGVNGLCWPRELPDGFAEVLQHLASGPGITTLDESHLLSLPVSAAGHAAIDFMRADQKLLQAHGLDPVLDCVNGYPPHEQPGPVRTDVCSFHVDSATVEADTYLCTYHGASSEGLRNDEAQRRVDLPATRAELLKTFGGNNGDEFLEYLEENCFDLHYAPAAHAQPFSFGLGNLWRIAVKYPGSPVPAFIHRAPDPIPGQPRLLLIS